MNTLDKIHPDLAAACINQGVKPERVSTHYSDVRIGCASHEDARKLKDAGQWRSMAEIYRTNPLHPDAKRWPWGLDVPLANPGEINP